MSVLTLLVQNQLFEHCLNVSTLPLHVSTLFLVSTLWTHVSTPFILGLILWTLIFCVDTSTSCVDTFFKFAHCLCVNSLIKMCQHFFSKYLLSICVDTSRTCVNTSYPKTSIFVKFHQFFFNVFKFFIDHPTKISKAWKDFFKASLSLRTPLISSIWIQTI